MFSFYFVQKGNMGKTINERGCIDAGEEWLGRNVIVVAGVAVGIAFLQVIFLFILSC